jgi:hypothetical protein
MAYATSRTIRPDPSMPTSSELEISLAILRHLASNPEGMDTLEGIARFWIGRHRVNIAVEEVAGAVDLLLERGYVKKRILHASHPENHTCFQLNHDHLEEIRALLGDKSD